MASEIPDIVSTAWLNDHLNDPNIRILDVTWYSSKNAKEDYVKEHIPGAIHFDIFKDVINSDVYPRSLPTSDVFQTNVRAAGVNNDSHVILYDSEGRNGFFCGSRAWFTFSYFGHKKVSILDGGLQKWKSDGFLTTADVSKVEQGNFDVCTNDALLSKFDFMKANVGEKKMQVLDSRAADTYRGKPEDKKTGHVPGAINITFASKLLDTTKGTLKSPDDLKQVFQENGVDLDKPVVTMCGSGMSSCSLLLAAKIAGAKQFSIYQAGFTEWKSRAEESDIEQS